MMVSLQTPQENIRRVCDPGVHKWATVCLERVHNPYNTRKVASGCPKCYRIAALKFFYYSMGFVSRRAPSCLRLPVVAVYLSDGKVKAVSNRQMPRSSFSLRVGRLV